MPQMSPLMWLILYIYFILLFLMVNILIYYFLFNLNNNLSKFNNIKFKKFKWLW